MPAVVMEVAVQYHVLLIVCIVNLTVLVFKDYLDTIFTLILAYSVIKKINHKLHICI